MPQASQWRGQPSIRGPNETIQMILLTFSLFGMVFVWSLETTYCTPYLLKLGMSKTSVSFAWLAGPASSMILQPIVGTITDRSTSRFGRRRPTMIICAIATGIAVITLGWTAEFVGLFVEAGTAAHQNTTIVVAVLSVYAVDISINLVQACGRSLIVDVLPIPKQQLGAAWATRLGATGHILAYLIGLFDLVDIFPSWLGGDTQFKKMTVVSATFLWLAVGVTSCAVQERLLLQVGGDLNASVHSTLSTLWYQTLHLPRRINQICWVQFWSWIGWFPILFYGSTWVGETYFRYDHPEELQDTSTDVLGKIGRLGSTAFVIFSLINFAGAYFIPLLVKSPEINRSQHRILNKHFSSNSDIPAIFNSIRKPLERLQPDIVTAWIISNLFFAIICLSAPLVRSLPAATTVIALAGIPWVVTVWAPFSEMGVEINRLAGGHIVNKHPANRGNAASSINMRAGGYAPVGITDEDGDEYRLNEELEMEAAFSRHSSNIPDPRPENPRRRSGSPYHSDPYPEPSFSHYPPLSPGVSANPSRPKSQDDLDAATDRDPDPDPDVDGETDQSPQKTGLYLGVLNIYTHLPQFIGTGVNWLVFLIFEPNHTGSAAEGGGGGGGGGPDSELRLQTNGPNAISICLLVGAVCSLIGAEAGRRLKGMRSGSDYATRRRGWQ